MPGETLTSKCFTFAVRLLVHNPLFTKTHKLPTPQTHYPTKTQPSSPLKLAHLPSHLQKCPCTPHAPDRSQTLLDRQLHVLDLSQVLHELGPRVIVCGEVFGI